MMKTIRLALLLLSLMWSLSQLIVLAEDEPIDDILLTEEQLAEFIRPEIADCADFEITSIPESECHVLADLYNATNGQAWVGGYSIYDLPWFTTDNPCNWLGVGCNGRDRENQHIHFMRVVDRGLRGTLPDSIGDLPALRELDLSLNRLSGEIPATIGNLEQLGVLRLKDNLLNGSIPPELGNLSILTTLSLNENGLEGGIPPELGNLSQLRYLNFETNTLEGAIPSELGQLSKLYTLDLGYNRLSGTIPAELSQLEDLRFLHLHDNQLSGEIPPELADFTSLRQLDLRRNNLSGEIPAAFANIKTISDRPDFINVSLNQLTGTVPADFLSLRTTTLDLSHNQLTGPLPTTLANFFVTEKIDLSFNRIEGSVPGHLDASEAAIDLSYNFLSGDVEYSQFGDRHNLGFNQISTLSGFFHETNERGKHQLVPPILTKQHNRENPHSIHFQWSASLSIPSHECELSYATDPDGPWSIADGNCIWTSSSFPYQEYGSASKVVTFPEMGETYYVRVRSRNFRANIYYTHPINEMWTPYSNIVEVKIPDFNALPIPVLSKVYGINGYESPTTPRIFWSGTTYNHEAGYYELNYATSPDGPWSDPIQTNSRQAYGMELPLPQPDTTYYVRMRSITQFEWGDIVTDYSNIIEVQTLPDPFISMPIPLIADFNKVTIIMDRYYFIITAGLLTISTLLLIVPKREAG